jgi:hypothetical protein
MRHHEDKEQEVVFAWAAYHPELRWMHSIPNGGKRNPREAVRLKKQGQTNGVSDVFLPMQSNIEAANGVVYCGLYIEMKRRKQDGPSRVTKDQQDFMDYATVEGYKCAVCYGAEEAIDIIKWYLRW